MTAFTRGPFTDGALALFGSDFLLGDRRIVNGPDSAGLSDTTPGARVRHDGTAIEYAGLTDFPTPVPSKVQTPTSPPDRMDMSDNLVSILYDDIETDRASSVGVTDTVAFTFAPSPTDLSTITDSVIVYDRSLVFTDKVGPIDLGASPTLLNGVIIISIDGELAGVTDTLTFNISMVINDSVGTIDTVTKGSVLGTFNENSGLTDSISLYRELNLTDLAPVVESTVVAGTPATNFTDNNELSDTVVIERMLVMQDSMPLSEIVIGGTRKFRKDVGVTVGL